jgi:nucleoside-diphosphate-sugar epimerase
MKKILITGGAGFIGAHLSNFLTKKNFDLTVLDNLERGDKKNLYKNITFRKVDLRKIPKKIETLFKKSDIIIHLASKVGSWQYYEQNAYDVYSNNSIIDANVLRLIKKYNKRKYIYASSSHVYPENLQTSKLKKILKESDAKESFPILSYGLAKLVCEKQIHFLSQDIKNAKFIALRFVGIYGLNQNSNLNKGSLIPVLCKKAKFYPKYGYKLLTDGNEVRSYCHIDDTCEYIYKIIKKIEKINKFEVFNICSNQKIKIREIAKKIIKVSDKKIKLKLSTKKASGIDYQVCSNKKIIKFVNWKDKKKFDQGLEEIYNKL